MARLPRLALGGHLHHVLQRGGLGQSVFHDTADFARFTSMLADSARVHQVSVHAYVLLPDHLHLLVTPPGHAELSRFLQRVQRQYAHEFNARHGRSGTLWTGRYRSTVCDADDWLWPSMAFLDLHPVRSGLVDDGFEYPHSSARHYAGREYLPWLQPPAAWWRLGDTPFAREAAYRETIGAGLTEAQRIEIADATRLGWPLGSARFLQSLAGQSSRPVRPRRPGRPRTRKPAA